MNTCLIFAGGEGKRCRPLTKYIPKPLLPMGSKPMILHTMNAMHPYVSQYVVLVGYKSNAFASVIGNHYKGKPVHFINTGIQTFDHLNSIQAQWASIACSFPQVTKLCTKGIIFQVLGDCVISPKLAKHMHDSAMQTNAYVGLPVTSDPEIRWEAQWYRAKILNALVHLKPETLTLLLVCWQTQLANHESLLTSQILQKIDVEMPQELEDIPFFGYFRYHKDNIIETNTPRDYWNECMKYNSLESQIDPHTAVSGVTLKRTILLPGSRVENSTLTDCIVCPGRKVTNMRIENKIIDGDQIIDY